MPLATILVACTPANILVPVTPSVPLATILVACTPANTLVPVTPNVPDATMLVACTPANMLVPVTPNVPLNVAEVALITFVNVLTPPTYIPPPIPTPPATINAPELVELVAVVLTNIIPPVLNTPNSVPVNINPTSEPLLNHSK